VIKDAELKKKGPLKKTNYKGARREKKKGGKGGMSDGRHSQKSA